MNTSELLAISSAIVPDRPATISEGQRLSYADLVARADRLANALAGLGVNPGDRVAVLQVNSNEHVETYFATAKLDAVYVPLNFRSRADELTYMLNDSAASVLLVGERYVGLVRSVADRLESVPLLISLGQPVEDWPAYDEIIARASGDERLPAGDGEDLTMILYTSGTTGAPKGVMLSHNSFSSYILDNVAPADPDLVERNILSVPLYHVAGVQAMMAAVYGGRTLIIQRQFAAKEWMELVEREQATRAMMVPTMLKMLMAHPEFRQHDLSSLGVITYGADSMPLDVIRQAIAEFPGVSFINAFGQTETAATITMLPPEDHILEGTSEDIERKIRRLSSIGRPLDDVEVRIVDEEGAPVATGEIGEIVARGPRLMTGYWHQDEATAETLRQGWLHTGDLGYLDEDGYIFLGGRVRDFIKRGGEMVSPEEVEQVLHSHPAVDEAAIIGVPDADWGETVRAIVVLRDGHSTTQEEIVEYCHKRLASFKKPESVVFTEELPRNPMGKVLKRTLRERHGQPAGS